MVPLVVAVLWLGSLLSSSVYAATYYVSTAGSNSNNGLSEATAWGTIAYGVSQMVAGDTTYVMNGTYNEGVILFDTSGTQAAPITLINYPGHSPKIVFIDPNAVHRILIQNAAGSNVEIGWITIEGLEISNGYDGIKYYNLHDSTIRRNWIHDSLNQGILGTGTRMLIDRNIISHNGGFAECATTPSTCNKDHGIYAYGKAYTVTNNLIYDNLAVGIQQTGSSAYNSNTHASPDYADSSDWIIVHNTIAYQSYGSAINLWGTKTNNTRIENNIFYENAQQLTGPGQGIRFTGGAGTGIVIDNNHVYATTPGRTVFLSDGATEGVNYTQSGNVVNVSSPALINAPSTVPVSPDFRLTSTSPAINVGKNIGSSFCGAAPDAGAFELCSPSQATINNRFLDVTIPTPFAPIQAASGQTGWSVGCSPSCGTLTIATVTTLAGAPTTVRLDISGLAGGACTVDQTFTVSYSSTTGTLTDSILVGPYSGVFNQAVYSFTSFAVTNQCGAGGGGTPPTGPKLVYDLDGNATDSSGNGLNGTVSGGAFIAAKFSQGWSVTASTDTITWGWGSGINPSTQSFTVCAGVWIPPGSTNLNRILWGSTLGTDQRTYLSINGGTFRQGVQTSSDTTGSEFVVDEGWNHICQVFNATTDTATIYKNGVASGVAGGNKTYTSYTLASTPVIGSPFSTSLIGVIYDNFLVYDSVPDIGEIYASWQAPSGSGSPACYAQTQHRWEAIDTDAANNPIVLRSTNNTSIKVVENGAVALVVQIDCTGSNGSALAVLPYYDKDGDGTFNLSVPAVLGVDGISFWGDTVRTTLNDGATSGAIAGSLTPVSGVTVLKPFPSTALALLQNQSTTHRFIFRVGPIAGHTRAIKLKTDTGTPLSSYTPTIGATIEVISAQAAASF